MEVQEEIVIWRSAPGPGLGPSIENRSLDGAAPYKLVDRASGALNIWCLAQKEVSTNRSWRGAKALPHATSCQVGTEHVVEWYGENST